MARSTFESCSNGASDKGVFGGGSNNTTYYNTLDHITISTNGNAQDFGDLSVGKSSLGATSNGTNNRGVFGGGYQPGNTSVIEYIAINSNGNAQNFGNLVGGTVHGLDATSNGINDRGIFEGGSNNDMEYITISTTGNSIAFGNLLQVIYANMATSNGINNRGVFGGGKNGSEITQNVIEYITITSAGNSLDFGDLIVNTLNPGCTSNGVNNKGILAGGTVGSNIQTESIVSITINTLSNASDFADLTYQRGICKAISNA